MSFLVFYFYFYFYGGGGGLQIYGVAKTVTYQVNFHPKFNHPWQHSSWVADKSRWDFGQWMNSSIIHDSICKLIHKKCHVKSHHMILNIIFSVVISMTNNLLLTCRIQPNLFASWCIGWKVIIAFYWNIKCHDVHKYFSEMRW